MYLHSIDKCKLKYVICKEIKQKFCFLSSTWLNKKRHFGVAELPTCPTRLNRSQLPTYFHSCNIKFEIDTWEYINAILTIKITKWNQDTDYNSLDIDIYIVIEQKTYDIYLYLPLNNFGKCDMKVVLSHNLRILWVNATIASPLTP